MAAFSRTASIALLVCGCVGCHRAAPPAQQAQAPPLKTDGGTLTPPKNTQPQVSASPLASPLPPPSTQAVALPPPPPPKKVRHKVKPTKAPETQTVASAPQGATVQQVSQPVTPSPIGQLTTGDVASGERTKHETADLIGTTQQGLVGIKRSLSDEEKKTAEEIKSFLRQAQGALDSGDTDGAHTLATKARLLLDELTKP